MPNAERETRDVSNPFQEWMSAMANQRGELDLRLEGFSLKLPFIPDAVELNGTISISFHVRELTDKERTARAAREIRLMGT
jgi:hypothetical protein